MRSRGALRRVSGCVGLSVWGLCLLLGRRGALQELGSALSSITIRPTGDMVSHLSSFSALFSSDSEAHRGAESLVIIFSLSRAVDIELGSRIAAPCSGFAPEQQ